MLSHSKQLADLATEPMLPGLLVLTNTKDMSANKGGGSILPVPKLYVFDGLCGT